jgi:hypothetical protein
MTTNEMGGSVTEGAITAPGDHRAPGAPSNIIEAPGHDAVPPSPDAPADSESKENKKEGET